MTDQPFTDAATVLGPGIEIRQILERWEQLDAERRDAVGRQREVMAEAKGRGFDTKVLRILLRERRRKPADLREEAALLETYRAALDAAPAPNPF